MPARELQLTKRTYRALAAGRLADALALVHPELLIEESPPFLEAGPLRGRAGLARLLRFYGEAFGPGPLVVEEVVEVGGSVLVCLQLGSGEDGPRRPLPSFHLNSFRDGQTVRIEVFGDRSQALAAARQAAR